MDEQRVQAARIAALYRLAKPAYATTTLLGAILVAALWVPYTTAMLLGWLVALCAVTVLRVVLHWRYSRAADAYSGATVWENRFAIGALASGAVWSFAVAVFFPHGDPISQMAVVLITGGTTLGAAALFAPSARAVYAFGVLPVLAVVVQLLLQPLFTYRLLALCVALFGLVMARVAQQLRSHVVELVRANLRNEGLLARANASETQLRDAIESFPEGIAIWGADDRLVVCNERYAQLYGAGRAAAELVGAPFREVAANAWATEGGEKESDPARREEWIARRIAVHLDGDGTAHQYQARDGRWLQRTATRMSGGGWVGLVADITALKRAQEAYLEVLAEESLVLDTLPVGVAFVEHRVIARCNRRLERMLGYGPGELQGKSVQVWFNEGAAMEGEAQLVRKDGSRLWCQVLGRAVDPSAPEASAIFAFADAEQRVAAEQALKRSEQMYRSLVETSSELIWSLDADGRWTYLNAAGARRIYRREPGEMVGRPFLDYVARELRERDHAVLRRVLAGETVFNHETRHARRDGGHVDLSFNAIALRDAAGNLVGATGTARDVTEEKRALAALQESLAKLRLAVDAADLYYWEWDAENDRLQWGRDPGMLPALADGVPRKWADYARMVYPDDRERYLSAARVAAERLEPFELEYRVTTQDGRILWFSARGVPVRDASGRVSRMTGVSQDITAAKRREEAVRFLAYHDSLTGLPNRRLLDDRLKQALYQAQRRDRKVGAMLVDLDNFKQVNDSAGHRAGDAVLREVAQRLMGCVRKSDTLARHGGDEFIIVISDVQSEADCRIVAEKVLGALSQSFRVDGAHFVLGASIGLSMFPTDAGDADALLRNADAAMYRAKERGKNQYRFYGR